MGREEGGFFSLHTACCKVVLPVPSRRPCCRHAFATPRVFLRPSEKGFRSSGSRLPRAALRFSPRRAGRGGETSSGFGSAGVFPAPRRSRAGLPLVSRLLPAGHCAVDLSVLAGREGGGAYGSPPPPPLPPPLPKGRAARRGGGVRTPHVPGRRGDTAASPRYDGTGMGWRGAEHPWVLGGTSIPGLHLQARRAQGPPPWLQRGSKAVKIGVRFG